MFVCGSKHLDVYDEVYSYINVTILFHKIQTIFGQTGNTPLWEKLPRGDLNICVRLQGAQALHLTLSSRNIQQNIIYVILM